MTSSPLSDTTTVLDKHASDALGPHPEARATPADADAPGSLQPELTILMPCLNEKATLETCIRKALGFFASSGVAGEVVIADNGSTDSSQAIAEKAGARVIDVPERGYGAALLAGIRGARGRYVVMGDADDSYDFEHLEAMLAELRAGKDLVMGNRFQGGIADGAMPALHRYLGNPVLSRIGRLFYRVPIGDFHCGLRGFSRDAIQRLRLQAPGMEFASEMVVKAALNGLSIAEVPTTLSPDGRGRPPHLNTWQDGWRHLRFLLLHSPRWLFLYPGLVLCAVGLLGIVFLAGGQQQLTSSVAVGIHSLVASCFALLIGTQMIILAVLSRKWGMIEGFLPAKDNLQRFLSAITLETTLKCAAVLLLFGAAGVTYAAGRWLGSGLGPIEDPSILRVLVVSFTAISISVQAAAAAAFESVLAIRCPR